MHDEVPVWQHRGLCHQFPDIKFVPDPFLGEDSLPAKNVCIHCPVQQECLAYGREKNTLGVWGGEDEIDRLIASRDQPTKTCDCETNGPLVLTELGTVCTSCGKVDA